MSYAILEGKRFGKLLVLEKTKNKTKQGRSIYLCKCDCGNEVLVCRDLLTGGHKKSCGCLRKEKPNRSSHLMSYTREYRIWAEMIKRCKKSSYKSYSYYGGRGITVCDRWANFENFFSDMGKCPEGFTLDRIDVNGNYEPSNCRWASRKTQARNRRDNHMITFKNETHCLSEWAEIVGITRGALKQRLKRGWTLENALNGGAL